MHETIHGRRYWYVGLAGLAVAAWLFAIGSFKLGGAAAMLGVIGFFSPESSVTNETVRTCYTLGPIATMKSSAAVHEVTGVNEIDSTTLQVVTKDKQFALAGIADGEQYSKIRAYLLAQIDKTSD